MDEKFLKLLACPACASRPPLTLDEKNSKLKCGTCGRDYPICDGIPILLVNP